MPSVVVRRPATRGSDGAIHCSEPLRVTTHTRFRPSAPPLPYVGNKLVSVIVPCWNTAKWMDATFESIVKQSYSPIEVVAINPSSDDDTRTILESYQSRHAELFHDFKVVNTQRYPASIARNIGVSEACGEYIAFLDGDGDYWEPNYLACMVDTLTEYEGAVQVVYSDYWRYDVITQKLSMVCVSEFSRERLLQTCFLPVTAVMTRKLFTTVGGFDESLGWGEDYDLWLKCSELSMFKHVQTPLWTYNWRPGSTSHTVDPRLMDEENQRMQTESKQRAASLHLRVLHLIGTLNCGGGPRVALDIANHMTDVDSTIACWHRSDPLATSLSDRVETVVLSQEEIEKRIISAPFDVVHAHSYQMVGQSVPSSKLIYTIHGLDVPYSSDGRIRSDAAAYVCPSSAVRSMIRHQLPDIPPDRVLTIYNGVDTKLFSPKPKNLELMTALQLDPNRPTVGCVGRMAAGKGIEYLQQAAQAIGGVNLLIPGLNGVPIVPEPVSYYNLIDVYVCPSLSEGFSLNVAEAMSCGLPVIAAHSGAHPELVRNGETGFLVPPGDVQHLVALIQLLINDPELRQTIGGKARCVIDERFSIQHMITAYLNLYHQVGGRL